MKRICNKCGVEKELTEFPKGKRYTGGRRPTCSECFGIMYKNKVVYVSPKNQPNIFRIIESASILALHGYAPERIYELLKDEL